MEMDGPREWTSLDLRHWLNAVLRVKAEFCYPRYEKDIRGQYGWEDAEEEANPTPGPFSFAEYCDYMMVSHCH